MFTDKKINFSPFKVHSLGRKKKINDRLTPREALLSYSKIMKSSKGLKNQQIEENVDWVTAWNHPSIWIKCEFNALFFFLLKSKKIKKIFRQNAQLPVWILFTFFFSYPETEIILPILISFSSLLLSLSLSISICTNKKWSENAMAKEMEFWW